uniref:Uncharacterized protein n=1 Tax=Aegilops tauschii subsp. strangulata TaxID=200361 RepID=A0A453HX69_AEGTS
MLLVSVRKCFCHCCACLLGVEYKVVTNSIIFAVYDGSKLAHSLEPPVIKNNNRLTYLRNLHYPDTEPVADGIYSTHAMLIDDVKL